MKKLVLSLLTTILCVSYAKAEDFSTTSEVMSDSSTLTVDQYNAMSSVMGSAFTASEPRPRPVYYRDTDLYKKGVKMRKVGWSLLGGGVALEALSYANLLAAWYAEGSRSGGMYSTSCIVLFNLGTSAICSSIPVLITGLVCRTKAKKQAKRFNAGLTTLPAPVFSIGKTATPALAFSLDL